MKTASWLAMLPAALALLASATYSSRPAESPSSAQPSLTSLALRVHHLDRMTAFYTEAFGCRFREVETFGISSRFAQIGGMTLKLVPIRKEADFEGFPSHQPGFEVDDVERVLRLAVEQGGRQEGEIVRQAGRVHAAVRDPDGNTIELYSRVR